MRLTLSFLVVAIIAFIAPAFCADELTFGPDVVQLNKDNFDAFIAQDTALVAFTAPWCGHCKRLKSPYSEAATALKKDGIQLGNVDSTIHGELASRFGVRGYPTLKIFKNGNPTEFEGARTKEGIMKTVLAKAGPAFKDLKTAADAKAFIGALPPAYGISVIGVFPSGLTSPLAKSFLATSESLRELRAAAVASPEAAASLGLPATEGVHLYRTFAPKDILAYTGDVNSSNDLVAWVGEHALPIVGWYDDAYAPFFRQTKKAQAKVFVPIAATEASQIRYFSNRVKKAAEAHKDLLVVGIAGTGDGIARQEVAQFGFSKNPVVVIQDKNDDSIVYKMAEPFTPANVEAFFASYAAGTLDRYIKSEPVPDAAAPGEVAVVVGKTFDKLVGKNDEQDVMIEFYAPWCGHCKSLAPKYDALAKKIADEVTDRNILVAKLDATSNDWTRGGYPVKGYPTLFFKPAGGEPQVYSGARETDALFDYIIKNGKSKAPVGKDEL